MRFLRYFAAMLLAFGSPICAVHAQTQPAASHWITLGTQGGPIPGPKRSQPANVLLTGDGAYLVDAGDGAAEQLAKAGVPLAQLKAVVISHLHFDHTAGLLGILGLRYQTNIYTPLTIYGPPGTKQLVDGLLAAMLPTAKSGYGMPGSPYVDPGQGIEVVELRDGANFRLGAARVVAAKNTHYSFAPGSDDDRAFESLSYRFELPDRVIVYSGDTGPSDKFQAIARDADLLVVEMIDVERTLQEIRRTSPNLPEPAAKALETHLRTHHLTGEDVGKLAGLAHAKAVVVTHLSAPEATGDVLVEYLRQIGAHYPGPVVIARDLEEF